MADVDEDLAACTRCTSMVSEETLLRMGDWRICEDCWGDL